MVKVKRYGLVMPERQMRVFEPYRRQLMEYKEKYPFKAEEREWFQEAIDALEKLATKLTGDEKYFGIKLEKSRYREH